ncbi:MAG: anti-sigma factor [Candidatus Eremiobacteraeota bacterium]|nr:anti-sigma factor [Candidatus Eremiobacteraeota bacterium]MBV8461423.1 anti-sigma factor [Candidatus Eremiobacteraeota bacterium]MBV8670017.1 anti-sigma factor [Candidatus Eremiobacteraeota bacterium]MBV8671652.1 anti-sigma factor [Candidatus Eremiobacteraeota bacterium]
MSAQHDDAMLDMVAAYAIGAIDASTGECAVVRAHLAQCATCREEFAVARAATAALGLSAAQAPPATLRDRILVALPARLDQAQARRSRAVPWLVPAAAAAAVIVAAGIWWNTQHQTAQSWAASCVPSAANCHAYGTVSVRGGGVLHVQLQGLAALPAGKQYQAWMIPPGGAPKPEPVFSPDANGGGTVDMQEAPVKGAIVAVTVEKSGGATAPTTKPFLVAKLD